MYFQLKTQSMNTLWTIKTSVFPRGRVNYPTDGDMIQGTILSVEYQIIIIFNSLFVGVLFIK